MLREKEGMREQSGVGGEEELIRRKMRDWLEIRGESREDVGSDGDGCLEREWQ